MKAAITTNSIYNANRVFTQEMTGKLRSRYELCDEIINRSNISDNLDFLENTQYLFSTWGMEHFSVREINEYFPSLKCLFYAAGSVQEFAKEFLDCGIRVFSAWQANAVPVAEYTYAQIILAAKGFFFAERNCTSDYYKAAAFSENCGGNYNCRIGIIGVGCIGSMVAERLKNNNAEVFYYDPFLPDEKAKNLNIKKTSLEEIFSNCDIISNHLANKDELEGVLSGELFSKMKPYATFINTGRGRQIDEPGLLKAMKDVKTRTALLDVTAVEPIPPDNELAKCSNIIITPHIAGSLGREVVRMAEYMADEAERIDKNKAPLYEVTAEMLETMA